MASGKSCSVSNPDGVRRTVSGRTLAKRSQRKCETIVETVQRWFNDGESWSKINVNIERKISKVFIE